MRQLRTWKRVLLAGGLLAVIPALFLEGLRLTMDAPFTWGGLVLHWSGVAGLLIVAILTCAYPTAEPRFVWSRLLMSVPLLIAGAMVVLTGATWAAWLLVGTAYLALLCLEPLLTFTLSWFRRWFWRFLLAATAGAFPVVVAQFESHFADEEFFVALEALALGILWLLLLGLFRFGVHRTALHLTRGTHLDRRLAAIFLVLVLFAGLSGTLWMYRHSFYPSLAPSYPGISAQTPFLCGQVQPDSQIYDGQEVYERLLRRVQAHPNMGPQEYAVLALGTGEQRWADTFHDALLLEAQAGKFTGPAYSVKAGQFEAALRAYYFPRMRERFPELFSPSESAQITAWFAAINRRALTVEAVDLMYALAFSKWPEGPYENQENGAGLLAVLEAEDLADNALSASNQAYLAHNPRGWAQRFRVTDDAFIYQPMWIDNAYFQSLYAGAVSDQNLHLSFEWLFLQALPDGAFVRYNHPGVGTLAGMAYLGAEVLDDPRYIWFAGRAVTELEERDGYFFAQPGMEQPLSVTGQSPTEGSCLLFGDSGLPNQIGPLAPDKIVFRDGWSQDAAYLLLNLRFTGWHRYKGTGTVTLLYQDGVLAADVLDGQPFSWLPVGRSMFRDKRIPRENLNGLVVAKTGMAAVLYRLTGVGGPWAQDPPYYAEVLSFSTGATVDSAHIRLSSWRGWQHDRMIFFYHDGGPIIVVDEAQGSPKQAAALIWHLTDSIYMEAGRFRLRADNAPVDVVLLPQDGGEIWQTSFTVGTSNLDVVYYGDSGFRVVTVFLPKAWVGADVAWHAGEDVLEIAGAGGQVNLPLFSQP